MGNFESFETNGTSAQRAERLMRLRMAYDVMSRSTELEQADRIARHYMGAAASANHLLKIINLVRYEIKPTDDAKSAIASIAKEIKEKHAYDLGIELYWP